MRDQPQMIWTVEQEVTIDQATPDKLDAFARELDADQRALGPACSTNLELHTLSAIFSVADDYLLQANATAWEIFAAALDRAGIVWRPESPQRFSIELELDQE